MAVGPLRGQESSNRPIEGSPCSRQISRHEPHGFPLLRRARESDGGSVPRARDRDGGVIPRGVQLGSGRCFARVPTAGSRGITDVARSPSRSDTSLGACDHRGRLTSANGPLRIPPAGASGLEAADATAGYDAVPRLEATRPVSWLCEAHRSSIQVVPIKLDEES
jgi:hypothetical protein